jgi:hypothetical protein
MQKALSEKKNLKVRRPDGMAQLEYLPKKHKALSSKNHYHKKIYI